MDMSLGKLQELVMDKGGLVCCDSWGHKESDMTERLNWTVINWHLWWQFCRMASDQICVYCMSFNIVWSTYSPFGFRGQNLTQTDQRCVPEPHKKWRVGTFSGLEAIIFSGWTWLYSSVCCSGADLVFLVSCCLFLSFSPWLVFPAYWPCTWPPPPTLSWLIRLNIHCQLAVVSCVLGQIQEGVRLPNFLEFIWVLGCLWEMCMASQSSVWSLG